MKHPVRLLPLAAIALVASGCSVVNPITTHKDYNASDGITVEVGDVKGINLLVVTEAKDSPAVLVGTLHNYGTEDVQVSASIDGSGITTIDVPAGASVTLGGQDAEEHVEGTSTAAPGLVQPVTLQTDATGQVSADVPVLDGTLEEYASELDGL
ncbi:hypothetical protein [Demequina soli]|uniref:hypothetical protein n=1 Tax=Demequina soli TaxID=1638987 RepID=UPI000780C0DB|nr:hypothetical protein [Demequina soli]